MLTLIRRRINLDSQNAPTFLTSFTQNPNSLKPSTFRPFATAATLLRARAPIFNHNRTPRNRHALDGLVTSLLKQRRTRDALRVFDIMSRPNFGKDSSTFNPIIKWLTSRNDSELALHVVRTMRASNVEPDSATYNYIVRACFGMETSVADELLRGMREKGMEPDGQTNHVLVLRVLKTQKVEVAVALVKRKLDGEEVLLYVTHCVVVRVMVECRSLRKTVEYVRMVCETDKEMGCRVFRFLARKLGLKGRNREAGVVVGEMVKRGLPVDGKKLLSGLASKEKQKAT